MILILAIIALVITVYMFVKDMGNQQVISSRFDSFYKPFQAETVVQHEYVASPDLIWKTLTALQDYCLWFPGINRMLPVVDTPRYVHRFSFDQFLFEPGAFIKIRSKSFLPWFKGRILGIETSKRLEMEMRFSPINKETVSFQINLTPSGSSEVVCRRSSYGLFSFLTTWGFADHGSAILHNLARFIPEDKVKSKKDDVSSDADTGPQLSRETIIAQAVQAGLDGNMDLINVIPDKPTRGLAKAALIKSKRIGGMPENLKKALTASPVAAPAAATTTQASGLPNFSNNDELIAYVVNKALDGDMDPINSIPEKPLRGKAKAAMVRAKRTGERPDMPQVQNIPAETTVVASGVDESEDALIVRLIEAGLQGNMDEINALENKVVRGKIKSAIVRAKRAAK